MEDLLLAIKKLGISEEEIEHLIEEKRRSLGYLIDEDVALRLIARDLGILIHEGIFLTEVKIKDLVPNMRSVTLNVTLEKNFGVREFDRKDGSKGKFGRGLVKDDTGSAFLVLWNDKAEVLHKLKSGAQIVIKQGYTREGMDGSLEIHVGERSEIEIVREGGVKGRILKIYDPLEYIRDDGSKVRLLCFLIKGEEDEKRAFLWNPSEEFLKKLIEGMEVEIIEGQIREKEIYIKKESHIRVTSQDIISINNNVKRFNEIEPNMKDFAIEGIIESEPEFGTAQSGSKFAKIILREGDVIIPVIFWNEKVEFIKNLKRGDYLFIDGCRSRAGPNGVEIIVNKWSKIRVK
ncbi:MAG: OB-fold nucleic acid binding domain-containing protein [Candidatus Methanomethyliaceae archaeon]|nr:OB-fold nucleic acid binding domain-containing protein [Candidatus Methanomethyliaceae archaeon]